MGKIGDCMVKCLRCNIKCKRKYRIKDEDHILLVWECPECGRLRYTKRKGKMLRYYTDEKFRESEKERLREYYRKYGK